MLFSVAWQCVLSHFSHILLFVTLWTVTCQAPQSMGILLARILDWVAMLFSRDLPDARMEPAPRVSPTLVGGSFTSSATWEVLKVWSTGVGESESEVAQSCPTLCNPVDCSLPGSSIHGILQARVLEWVAISFSRDLLYPGIEPGSPTLQVIPYCLSHQVKFQNLPCLHRLMTSLQNFLLIITFNHHNKNGYIDVMLEFWNRVMNKK